MTVHRTARALLIFGALGLVLLALDLGTKEWALDALSTEREGAKPPLCEPDADGFYSLQRLRKPPIVWVEGYFELRYAENCGAAFGIMSRSAAPLRALVFALAAILASGTLGWMLFKGRGGVFFAWSVPLIVSGAIGNLVDRMRHGFVVDFLRFHIRNGWEWPTFNVADASITVGVALLLLDGLLEGRRADAEDAKRAEAPKPTKSEAQKS